MSPKQRPSSLDSHSTFYTDSIIVGHLPCKLCDLLLSFADSVLAWTHSPLSPGKAVEPATGRKSEAFCSTLLPILRAQTRISATSATLPRPRFFHSKASVKAHPLTTPAPYQICPPIFNIHSQPPCPPPSTSNLLQHSANSSSTAPTPIQDPDQHWPLPPWSAASAGPTARHRKHPPLPRLPRRPPDRQICLPSPDCPATASQPLVLRFPASAPSTLGSASKRHELRSSGCASKYAPKGPPTWRPTMRPSACRTYLFFPRM